MVMIGGEGESGRLGTDGDGEGCVGKKVVYV